MNHCETCTCDEVEFDKAVEIAWILGLKPPPVYKPPVINECNECDVSFPCYDKKTPCFRLPK